MVTAGGAALPPGDHDVTDDNTARPKGPRGRRGAVSAGVVTEEDAVSYVKKVVLRVWSVVWCLFFYPSFMGDV